MPKLDFRYLKNFISDEEFSAKVNKAEEAHRTLMTKSGAGSDFTGFVELPEEYDREEFSRILSAAEKIVRVRDEGEIYSKSELQDKAQLSRAVMEILNSSGVLDGMSETNQLSLF